MWKNTRINDACCGRALRADLSPLRPEWRIKLAVGKEAILKAGEELEQMTSFREAKWRSLDPVLTDQHCRPPTVHYEVNSRCNRSTVITCKPRVTVVIQFHPPC